MMGGRITSEDTILSTSSRERPAGTLGGFAPEPTPSGAGSLTGPGIPGSADGRAEAPVPLTEFVYGINQLVFPKVGP